MRVILLHRESAVSILTITLHPAIDKVLRLRRLRPNDTARAEIEMVYGGGKGNNVARALTRLGIAVTASGFQGGYSGDFATRSLNDEGIHTRFVACCAPTRTSLLIHEEETRHTYAVYEPGQEVTTAEIHMLEDTFIELLPTTRLCLLCGSGQSPALAALFGSLISLAAERAIPVIVDSSGISLKECIQARPAMLKVNAEELQEGSAHPASTKSAQVEALRALHAAGIPRIALTFGEDGLLLSDGTTIWEGSLPMQNVINTVGCGDSTLAGIAKTWIEGGDAADMVRWGVACGAANTQAHGAGFIDPQMVNTLLPRVAIRSYPAKGNTSL